MLKNYYLLAIRSLVKSPGLSLIKIIGLSIGICGCLVIFLLTNLELSFDKYHTQGENVYRVYTKFSGVWEGTNHAVPLPFPNAFRDKANGVEAVSQTITESYDVTISDAEGNQKEFVRPNFVAFIDSNYFKVFRDYRWINGSPEILSNPGVVVLTESKAKVYFGNDISDVVGKAITYRDSLDLTVAGIVADPPGNTDFNFTDFISASTIQASFLKGNDDFEEWGNVSSQWMCLIRVLPGTNMSDIDKLLKQMSEDADKKSLRPGETQTTFTSFQLQPLSDIHFNTTLGTWDSGRQSTSMGTIKALVAIALLLLFVAAINFVNLETAQAIRRAREVGIRKVMGGTHKSLIISFLAESFVVTGVAVLLSLPLTKVALIFFSEFLPKEMSIDITNPVLLLFLSGLTLVVALLAGIYPAMVLSSYQPVEALKMNTAGSKSGSALMRKVLTVFQFTFSQALIAGALIIGLQITWMMNKDLGFSKDAIVNISTPYWENAARRTILVQKLDQMSSISMISQNSRPPAANGSNSTTMHYNDGKEDIPFTVNVTDGDTAYIRLFGLELIAGRNVQPVDSLNEIVINKTFCDKLHVLPIDMVGKDLKRGDGSIYHVVGVLKDFHHASLHRSIEPWMYLHRSNKSVISVRVDKSAKAAEVMEMLTKSWKEVYPDTETSIAFMDETVQKFYENEQRIAKLASTATGLAIFISCLGLFALASFTSLQRTKEIGIRKVLGASVNSIVVLLSREFLLLIVISLVLATPIAWYAGGQWLNTFPYRMDLGIWIFAASGVLSILIAFITVGFQALKAAVVNPVESLKYE